MKYVLSWGGIMLLYLGIAAFYAADILAKTLPERLLVQVLQHKGLLVVVGVMCLLISIFIAIGQHKKNTRKKARPLTTTTHTESPTEAPTDPTHNINWEPLVVGGTNFRTVALKQISPNRLIIERTSTMLNITRFVVFFCLLLPLGLLLRYVFEQRFTLNTDTLLPMLAILPFSALAWVLWRYPRPRIFDTSLGWFWHGSPNMTNTSDIARITQNPLNGCKLCNVVGLQLIAKSLSNESRQHPKKDDTCFELNLICADGSRCNVLNHGDHDGIQHDAHTLSTFLNVPILTPT